MLLGIDFGTSFSQAAAMQINEPVLLMPSGTYGIPTAFYYDKQTGALVGYDALDEGQGINSANLITDIKTNLSKGFISDGRGFSPEDMVSRIYKYVTDTALRVAQQKCVEGADTIDGVVISAPVNFSAHEITLLKKACMRPAEEGGAALPVCAVIKEPVAAAVAYLKISNVDAENILVFDLGGGTCDIALLHSDEDSGVHYSVVDSDMIRVGAKLWDERLANYIAFELSNQAGTDITLNPAFMRKVRAAAIEAKHSLTEYEHKNARIEINGRVYKVALTRRMFDALTATCREQVLELLSAVYNRNKESCNITDIICVGGGSLMPQIANGIRERIPECKVHSFCPETAVVFGTAIYAQMLNETSFENAMQIDDISSFSYGIRVFDDYDKNKKREIIANLIVKGDTLPASSYRTFKTVKKGDGKISISVYENTVRSSKCEIKNVPKDPIGKVVLEVPPKTPAGTKIHVTMKLNTSRMLEVSARDDNNNSVKASFEINTGYHRQ